MKFIGIIISIYFLALNLIPCSDSAQVLPMDGPEMAIHMSTGEGHGHAVMDLCSPFCHCHCCHVHTIHFGAVSFEPLQSSLTSGKFGHFEGLSKDIAHSILQPPRV